MTEDTVVWGIAKWLCVGALALGGAAMARADEHESPYRLRAMAKLSCEQINDKVEEGKKLGDPEAFYTTALLMSRKVCFRFVPKSYIALLEQAAERGHRQAKDDLGLSYALGQGVQQSYQKAGELMLEANDEDKGINAYSYGYARSLARLVHRYTFTIPRYVLRYEHWLKVNLQVNPLGRSTVSVSFEGTPRPETQSEAPEAMRIVQGIAQDALDRAVSEMPSTDKARLQSVYLSADWGFGVLHDSTMVDAPPRVRVEPAAPVQPNS